MTTEPTDCLLVASDGAVRVLTMNRPAKRNALNTDLTQKLLDALLAADLDPSVSVIVLGGAGQNFCAGADIGEFSEFTPSNADLVAARADLTTRLHKCFSALSKPVIGAVQGRPMGGGAGLALACDLLVMAQDAALAYPEVKRGIVPAVVMSNLVRQIGRKLAFEMVITGSPLPAPRALELGIANRVVAADALDETAMALAQSIAAQNPQALTAIKTLFYRVADLTFDEGMDEGRRSNIAMRGFQNANAVR